MIKLSRTVGELNELMKIRCYIMCYYPVPDAILIDRIKVDIRLELLKDFLKEDIINKEVYEKLIRK